MQQLFPADPGSVITAKKLILPKIVIFRKINFWRLNTRVFGSDLPLIETSIKKYAKDVSGVAPLWSIREKKNSEKFFSKF